MEGTLERLESMKELKDYLYYEEKDPDLKIYLGDCLSILPLLPNVDLVVTDPPYGIKADSNPIRGKFVHENIDFDQKRPERAVFDILLSISDSVAIWGGNYFADFLPPRMGWLFWDKCNGEFSLSDGELCWTSKQNALRMFRKSRASVLSEDKNWHPTQKPVTLIKWTIKYLNKQGVVFDPFLGSGTTLVACKELNRNGIGIEISEKYCAIAKKRLQNTTKSLFTESAKQPEQKDLL